MEHANIHPENQGLYDSRNEHDNCGIGLIVDMKGRKSHDIVRGAIDICTNLDHRGGCGCDPITGDGAGVFIQLPHNFFKTVCPDECGFDVPEEGDYGVGFAYLSRDPEERKEEERIIEKIVAEEGLSLIGWRDVPVRSEILGKASAECEPFMRQVFIGRNDSVERGLPFERKLYIVRRLATHRIRYSETDEEKLFYFSSLSAMTMIYKGMLTTEQLSQYFPDLSNEALDSALALSHSRFSTNTFPNWPRAQPFRYLCHNGEINTVRGNENWLHARQMQLASEVFGDDLKKILPIIREDGSDSQKFDNCLEFLVLSGRSLAHAMMMMIPEPWERHNRMPQSKRDFYEFHACIMEPWDGPASIAFSDGVQIGATLDRNGLRPSRYYVTTDDRVILASEVGVLPDIDPANVVRKGRLEPGRMFLVDMEAGRIIEDAEVKEAVASEAPYGDWLRDNLVHAEELPEPSKVPADNFDTLLTRQKAFGYSFEDVRFILGPSAETGKQPLGSMGNDAPLAVLSDKPQPLYNYFKQLFAQVTNPPIDPIREELITASVTFLGSEGELTRPGPDSCRMLKYESPLIDDKQLAQLRHIELSGFRTAKLPITFEAEMGGLAEGHNSISEPSISGRGLETALEKLFENADVAVNDGVNLLILSDRKVNSKRAPIPALLAVAGLHHHLIRQGTRTRVSLVLESGEPREVHHFALLLGYGADAINPYLAMESIRHMVAAGEMEETDPEKACAKFLKANLSGVIKTMSKMGISTIASYRGAQIFEAIGLNDRIIDQYFTKTSSRIQGIGLDTLAKETEARHNKAFGTRSDYTDEPLDPGGVFQWRHGGERHLFNPATIHKLQQATRLGEYEAFREYSELINNQSREMYTLRGLMEFRKKRSKSVPLEEVEPVESIVKRFKTGAMSYGSISKEAHEALAIAMNRIGGRSNTGEGGEDYERFTPDPNGDSRRSSIKQVASGRFGVTNYYLINADELQIKIVQGAKPGEGGELPGHKVLPPIAKTRNTTPGVGLISPPPHHDIYSIEDLAELVHDLKNANTNARVNVKLVSAVGVGTIAAGVAKAKADVILVSGYDGGTGASPRSSIQHAGAPWELGLAETNQTLLLNDLRSRVVVETDGQLKTGRDVAIACLLGAEEFGFATAPLVTLGCLMMRVCHKNTCPVGIATQDPVLRKKYMGAADAVVNFMYFVAEELREIMAELGFRTINEMVGRVDKLEMRSAVEHWKAKGLDYSKILHKPKVGPEVGTYCRMEQDHLIGESLDMKELLRRAEPAVKRGEPVEIDLPVLNTNRVVGTITGSEICRNHGPNGLPEDTLKMNFTGSAGQSFGAFCPRGMTLTVTGDTNDYLGKGLSGAKIIVRPPENAGFVAHESIITGNVCFYGATEGEAYIAGMAGERFCVRNSGVEAVVEGLGDHGLEYMTGGKVVCLATTGRNFAAGMSGGIGYVYDEEGDFTAERLNPEMVNVYQLIECTDREIEEVKSKIEQHVAYTGSARGREILDNWTSAVGKFIKIMPQDYERVVQALARAEERGLEGDEAIQAAFEENVKAGH